MARVFIDGRDLETAIAIREAILPDGYDVELVESARELSARLGEKEDVALFLTVPPADEVSKGLRSLIDARIPRPPVIAVAAPDAPDGGRGLAEAHGVDEVLSSPLDPEEARVVLEAQLDRYELQRETGIIGRTQAVREVLERVHLIAPVHSTVLLTGESGTGKELVARAIHRLSPRRGKSFIAVNCAALPESLLESELFGHEKGAFTGATSLRRGMFELADGGTLLLDEIAEMPLSTQTRLLRVLESRRFMRVGGDREISVNVRVIAATNRELREAVEMGEFRRDLYYRLNVLHIGLPPLRERREDIPLLVRRFVADSSRTHDREFRGLTPEAMEILLAYSWPGNVRELRNLVESMVVLAPGSVIRPEDIPEEIRQGRGRSMLPAPRGSELAPLGEGPAAGELAGSPHLEFVFRTLVALKVDVEDLKREFEAYKGRLSGGAGDWGGHEIEVSDVAEEILEMGSGPAWEVGAGEGPEAETRTIAFEPGMTMAELEREAIVATLRSVDGNRRKAAEKLQIGERTLYRKIKQYDIEI